MGTRHLRRLGIALWLATPIAALAQTEYQIRPIARLGEVMGTTGLKAKTGFFSPTLNDQGRIVFATVNDAAPDGSLLMEFADGNFTPIVVPGADAPGGRWSKNVYFNAPLQMNRDGNVAFGASVEVGGFPSDATFLWDAKARKVSSVAVRGMPSLNNVLFEQGSFPFPIAGNGNEIVFPAVVRNAKRESKSGVYLRGADGAIRAVAVPDQPLPEGVPVSDACVPSINDAGEIAMRLHRATAVEERFSAYRWSKGTLTPVLRVGESVPNGGKVVDVWAAFVNNANNRMLLWVLGDAGPAKVGALYTAADGKVTPTLAEGQSMPGGGTLFAITDIGPATDRGEHPILATISEGGTTRAAAYMLSDTGTPSLILKIGQKTAAGTIMNLGGGTPRISANNKGEILVSLQLDNGPRTLALLTPKAP